MSAPVMAAVAASALVVSLPVIIGANIAVASQRAASAADAAALAAADAALGYLQPGAGEPCEIAAMVAHLNGAEITGCNIEDNKGEAVVTVVVRVGFVPLSGAARAGPPAG